MLSLQKSLNKGSILCLKGLDPSWSHALSISLGSYFNMVEAYWELSFWLLWEKNGPSVIKTVAE